MKQAFSVQSMTRIAVVAAIYAVMTIAISPLSYGQVQFRVSELLVLLCFFRMDYCISLTLGCAIANLFSPMAAVDVPFGTFATLLSVICIYKSHRLWLASLFPVLFNGIIVGLELRFFCGLPLLASMLSVAAGELVVVTVLGVPCFTVLRKNALFRKTIQAEPSKLMS